ncbi:hypothetical protein [Deinococcus humi]|uniref:Uncharacterized protein n=1 Tax=Deinococcus humi TaxID=662880 RepID=A0A7W8JY42_9DEIO|nr:hypothetical protein [Deinococcus humi]MBB5365284.1 hypothetical protein [Deinococcus humi]
MTSAGANAALGLCGAFSLLVSSAHLLVVYADVLEHNDPRAPQARAAARRSLPPP